MTAPAQVTDEEGNLLALKLHRLGRTSFRNVKQKRDYLRSLTASYNWLHLSKLSALKEYAFMRALGEHGFPVPRAIELNRHAVLMSLVPATPLTQVRELANPHVVWRQAADIMVKLAQHGASAGHDCLCALLADAEARGVVQGWCTATSTSSTCWSTTTRC